MSTARQPIPDDDRNRGRHWLARCRRIQTIAKANLKAGAR